MDKRLTPDDLRKAGGYLHGSAYACYTDAWQCQLDEKDRRIAELESMIDWYKENTRYIYNDVPERETSPKND